MRNNRSIIRNTHKNCNLRRRLAFVSFLILITSGCSKTDEPSKLTDEAISKHVDLSETTDQAAEIKINEPLPEELPRLIGSSLSKKIVLLRRGENDYVPGLVVQNPNSKNGNKRDWVISEAIPNADKALALYWIRDDTYRQATLKKIADTDTGISIFENNFSIQPTSAHAFTDPRDQTQKYHSIQVSTEGYHSTQYLEQITQSRDALKTTLSELARSAETRNGHTYFRDASKRNEYHTRERELLQLEQTLNFPFKAFKLEHTPDNTAKGTFLQSADGTLSAIRSGDQWIDLTAESILGSSELESVSVQVERSRNEPQLTLELTENRTINPQPYYIVAETTYGLESIGSGSIEERLDLVSPIEVPRNYSNSDSPKRTFTCQMKWNDRPTTLWLRIYEGHDLETPIIEESMHIEMHNTLSARWANSPSPLIELPELEPNTPEDLVTDYQTIDLAGDLIDIVQTASEGVLLIHTNEAPYWQLFNFKQNEFLETPWTANEHTLLTTQANRLYRLDKQTKIVEIWDLNNNEKLESHILQIDGAIVSFTAPTHASQQPIMIITEDHGYLLDPIKFETILNQVSLPKLSTANHSNNSQKRTFIPNSIWARASADGREYTVTGLIKDHSGQESLAGDKLLVSLSHDQKLTGNSNYKATPLTDQAGTGITIKASGLRRSVNVGLSSGKIEFQKKNHRGRMETFAEIANSIVLPQKTDSFDTQIRPDRQVYLNTQEKILIIPHNRTLHSYHLNLGDIPKLPVEYAFSGEEITIALPKGSGHHVASGNEAEARFLNGELHWKPTQTSSREIGTSHIQIAWYGELGSKMKKTYSIRLVSAGNHPTLEMRGQTKQTLSPRSYIPTNDKYFAGFAGSGNVVLMKQDKTLEGWSLIDGQRLFILDDLPGTYYGDADYAYRYGKDGSFTAVDLISGEVRTTNLHEQLHLDVKDRIEDIYTGMSSRLPLVAIVKRDGKYIPYEISRASLKIRQPHISSEQQTVSFSDFETNASGSLMSSSFWKIFRDGKNFHIYSSNKSGAPDATGNYLVGRWLSGIPKDSEGIDLQDNIRYKQERPEFSLDESSQYLMIQGRTPNKDTHLISIRDLHGDLNVDLAQISLNNTHYEFKKTYYISESGKLVLQKDKHLVVYDLNINAK